MERKFETLDRNPHFCYVHRRQCEFLSAGGNDMAGSNGVNLEFYLNHALTNLAPLRDNRVVETFTTFNRAALEFIIQKVKAAKPGIEIFIHGYDYEIPDCRPVFKAPFGWNFIGPCCCPPLNGSVYRPRRRAKRS